MWAKVIVSLADIGYDSSTMVALPYDWRLSIPNLELRDGYFTRVRSQARSLMLLRRSRSATSNAASGSGMLCGCVLTLRAEPVQCIGHGTLQYRSQSLRARAGHEDIAPGAGHAGLLSPEAKRIATSPWASATGMMWRISHSSVLLLSGIIFLVHLMTVLHGESSNT